MVAVTDAAKPRIRVAAGDLSGASARLVVRNQAYEGAQSSRRLRSWTATSAHVNALLANAGPTLRNRLRQMVRSNPYLRRGRASYRSNLIGTGIMPSPGLADDPKRRARLRRAWSRWIRKADHDGRMDFYGIQRLVVGAIFTAGECFVRLVYLSAAEARRSGMEIPMRLQVLRAEMVPLDKTEALANGNCIRCGIEFDPAGRRVAYWVYRRDPTDATLPAGFELFSRVPAEEMIHVFDAEEPGQIRGEPPPVAAMVKAFVLDRYDDAELDRKATTALFAGFITEADTGDGALPNEGADENGVAIAGMQPGTLQKLLPGEDIKFAEPSEVGGSYEAFQYRTLLAIAAGLGLPYAAVTGDVTKVNYSSQRAALVEFRREAEQLQFAVYVFLLCQPVWDAWLAQVCCPARSSSPSGSSPTASPGRSNGSRASGTGSTR